jgi:hypothetical protein
MNNLFKIRHLLYLSIVVIIQLKYSNYQSSKALQAAGLLNRDDVFSNGPENSFYNFEKFDNQTGFNCYIVPNKVHYILMNKTELNFGHFLSILSAYLNQQPKRIYIHCDVCNFHGKYWNELMRIGDLSSILVPKKIKNFSRNIFGVKARWIEHKSDVLRNIILMKYGGIS